MALPPRAWLGGRAGHMLLTKLPAHTLLRALGIYPNQPQSGAGHGLASPAGVGWVGWWDREVDGIPAHTAGLSRGKGACGFQ